MKDIPGHGIKMSGNCEPLMKKKTYTNLCITVKLRAKDRSSHRKDLKKVLYFQRNNHEAEKTDAEKTQEQKIME